MKLIEGSKLTPSQAAQVRAAFVHRWHAIGEGKYYQNEQAWLNDHSFWFTKVGRLARRRYAEPAWLARDREA
jgi:hypothetical protein